MLDHHTVALAIRWLHVAAMAVAVGGAVLVTWISFRAPADLALRVAIRYEQLFWLAAGVLVMTGIGNLGALGSALPEPRSGWGITFQTKLLLVAALVAVSLPRSLALELARGPTLGQLLQRLYLVTVALFAAILVAALVLAHG